MVWIFNLILYNFIQMIDLSFQLNYIFNDFFPSVHLFDVYNIIEAFSENGLDEVNAQMELDLNALTSLAKSLYSSLWKRLPKAAQFDVDASISRLIGWILHAYDL